MNKSMILLTLVTLSSMKVTAEAIDKEAGTLVDKIKSGASQASSSIKGAGNYLLSSKGAQDLALAYCLTMGLTAIHELGHSGTARVLFGSPMGMVLGALPWNNRSYVQIGGITLGGLNPGAGYSILRCDAGSPLKEAAMWAAGPVFSALSSLGSYLLLKQYDGLYITKAAVLYGLFNHTLGIGGIGGIWTPGTDAYFLVRTLIEYREG